MATAYFAGGCFWCITPSFESIAGVKSVTSGYSGGDEANPVYADVKAQKTGHREAIRIEYDESKTDFSGLLKVFLENVDPYDGEGQFIDKGFSYTLAVFYTNDYEEKETRRQIEELEKKSGQKTYISVEKFKNFYDAEEYHQDYHLKNPEAFEKELIESGRKTDYKLLNEMLKSLIEDSKYSISNLSNASALIYDSLERLNWAGFYIMEDGKLILGPFQGKVACMQIKVGKGVCGTAVLENKTQVVADVHEFPGHIACDSASNSEIVIPIHKNGEVYGVLDIDSPYLNRFSEDDRKGLEEFVRIIEEFGNI